MRATGHNFIGGFQVQRNSTGDHHNKLVDVASSKRLYLQRLAKFQHSANQLNTSCVALFVTPVRDPVWLQIGCSHPFERNWFLCEHPGVPMNFNQTYLIRRKDIFCQGNMVYVIRKCWRVSRNRYSKVIAVHKDSTSLLSISSMLTFWSLANISRYTIRINTGHHHGCLTRNGFQYQRFVSWGHYSNCRNINATVHYLLSSNVRQTTHTCQQSTHFKCNDNTCVISSYVCDGYSDCLDNSDEINCTAVCTQDNTTCHHACVWPRCVCGDMYHPCSSHQCIPLTFVCDNWQHCEDSSDETNCDFGIALKADSLVINSLLVRLIIMHSLSSVYSLLLKK